MSIGRAVADFAISYSPWLRWFFTAMGLGPAWSGVAVSEDAIEVRLGWGFRSRIDRSAVQGVEPYDGRVLGWGAHGWRGRWLVNGSSKGIVVVHLDPPQRSHVLGWPIHLRELAVSVEDREGLLAALR
jgi:hypothetical protein